MMKALIHPLDTAFGEGLPALRDWRGKAGTESGGVRLRIDGFAGVLDPEQTPFKEMDCDEFRSILESSGVDVWTLIETAVSVASVDYSEEFKGRRDSIVERLYTPVVSRCLNCDRDRIHKPNGDRSVKEKMDQLQDESWIETPESVERDRDGSIDEEQSKILAIKERLEDPDQLEDSLVDLLQSLADMDITFKALKETDIGRHVNRLRKHPSNEVRRLVKQLVRKWKDLVDEWVKLSTPGETTASAIVADGDSPPQNHLKSTSNVHHQVPDFAYSPNPHNGSSGSDKNNVELEPKRKAVPRRETPNKPNQTPPIPTSVALNKQREQKDSLVDEEKLASARSGFMRIIRKLKMKLWFGVPGNGVAEGDGVFVFSQFGSKTSFLVEVRGFRQGKSGLGSMTVDGLLRNVYSAAPASESTLVDAEITLVDSGTGAMAELEGAPSAKTVDDVWREIVAGGGGRRECKEEVEDDMMTLEDFLAKAGAVEEEGRIGT
ncbi:putative mediator of RNA polymerase II transcription subunit 26c [Vitis vinifera]|uniref:Putative mediator of RNA polymerase II transcription subunit 26c n=1 Tax=Vitis vinifera TaxID=29760 RepID=A0A438EMN9_VITVI|nr:putative mediator of RNA polymerase II transcription subunit 26c [Vitis vinifera]